MWQQCSVIHRHLFSTSSWALGCDSDCVFHTAGHSPESLIVAVPKYCLKESRGKKEPKASTEQPVSRPPRAQRPRRRGCPRPREAQRRTCGAKAVSASGPGRPSGSLRTPGRCAGWGPRGDPLLHWPCASTVPVRTRQALPRLLSSL